MKKILLTILTVIISLYIFVCGYLYFYQEGIIFQPQKLAKNYKFQFDEPFEEINIKAKDGKLLNSLYFKAENAKGLIFYIHGNGGSNSSWGDISKVYTDLNYDLVMLDFRSYGKSEGVIKSEKQLFDDNQTVYNYFKKLYPENKIVVLGYSVGTGMAAKLASDNHPNQISNKLLILQAPYYNLTAMMQENFSFIPHFILRYPFETDKYLKKSTMPVILFHGTKDEVIPYQNSLKLQKEFKESDNLILLKGEKHNGITDNLIYQKALADILK